MYNHEPQDYNCPFCAYVNNLGMPGEVYRDRHIMAFISTAMWPMNPGIVIIIPNKHIENLYDMPDALLAKIHILAKRLALAMKKGYRCDGVSIRQHNEPAGNQEVMHYHFQVLPRYTGDDLYVNHKKKTNISAAERIKFAKLMKRSLPKIK